MQQSRPREHDEHDEHDEHEHEHRQEHDANTNEKDGDAIAVHHQQQQQRRRRQQQQRRPRKTAAGDGRGRNQPRASTACLNCRERRIKCSRPPDDANAACSACRAQDLPCAISVLGDRRRIQSKEQLAHLQDRVQLLEKLLARSASQQQLDEGGTAVAANREGSVVSAVPSLSLDPAATIGQSDRRRSSEQTGSTPTAESFSASNSQDTEPTIATDLPMLPNLSGTHVTALTSFPHAAPRYSPHASPKDSGLSVIHFAPFARSSTNQAENTSHAPDSRPIRLDSIAVSPSVTADVLQLNEDVVLEPAPLQVSSQPQMKAVPTSDRSVDVAQPQQGFYGPTSQLHVSASTPTTVRSDSTTDSSESDIRLDSNRVRETLIQSFWESQPLSTAIVERPRFERDREQGWKTARRCEYWSPFLENALLACASRMRTSADMRALGPRYCDLATADIVKELQAPHIATIQGFLLLSDFEATRGKERLGYQYCGIACCIIFDLGLHESCSTLVAQGRLSNADEISRCLLFLGTYVYDTLWSLYLGRPSVIPNGSLQAAQSRFEHAGSCLPLSLSAWVGLCTEIAQVTRILNDNKTVPLVPTAVSQLVDLDHRLSSRSDTFGPTLACNAEQLSELAVNAFGFHVQLRGIRIVLHKRLSETLSANGVDCIAQDDGGQSLEHSRLVMHEGSVHITRLVSTYVRIFGIENVITVMLDNMFVAAVTLIEHVLRISSSQQAAAAAAAAATRGAGGGEFIQHNLDVDISWLHVLSDILLKAQKHYPVTARMLSTLCGLVHGSAIAGIFGANASHDKVSFLQISNQPSSYPADEISHQQQRQHGKGPATTDSVGHDGWTIDLASGMDHQPFRPEPQSPMWSLDNGLGQPSAIFGTPAEMDPMNAMGWLMSPMES